MVLAAGCTGGTPPPPSGQATPQTADGAGAADGDAGRGVSAAELDAAVTAAIEGLPTPDSVTMAEVRQAIDAAVTAAVEGLPTPEAVSMAEVRQAVEAAVTEAVEGLPTSDSVSMAEVRLVVDAVVAAAVDGLPVPDSVSMAEVRQAIDAAVASAVDAALAAAEAGASVGKDSDGEVVGGSPLRSQPAAYTRHVVDEAIALYRSAGRGAAVQRFSDPASVDGQWYVFIVDAAGTVVAHPDQSLIGESLHGWVGTDVNGYNFGPEMLAADHTGRWVPYVFVNPQGDRLGDEGAFELKNAWVKRHDGLLFASGWHIDSETFLPQLINEAAEHFGAGGLEATLAFYNDPEGISAGLIPTVAYYNSTDTLQGDFSGFIAAPGGELLAHFDPTLIGTDIENLLGPAVWGATAQGSWITAADNPPGTGPATMRVYAVDVAGTLIGGGWYTSPADATSP